MSTQDISRLLEQPRKHYSGIRLQQGRLLLDADFNEGSQLSEEDLRRATRDLLGAKGSPNDGFSVGRPLPKLPPFPAQTELLRPGDLLGQEILKLNSTLTTVLPPSIRAGRFYLGGMRFEQEEPEHFALQRDYLQLKPEDVPPTDEENPYDFRVLYYLHAWEQCVTATEDEELLEVALGGEQTSTRVRRMRRVEALGGLGPGEVSCHAAFRRLLFKLQQNAVYDRETCELRSRGRLQLIVVNPNDTGDCYDCLPDPSARFLGANNQTLRVMLTAPDRFVWALDNAAPLFKVKVTGLSDPDPEAEIRVELLTEPTDESQWPLTNRVVEIVPFGAVIKGDMPPGEETPHFKKVAERIGAFSRVVQAYDPNTRTFTLDNAAGVEEIRGFVHEWDTRHPAAKELNFEPETDERYFYMRLWHSAPRFDQVEISTTSAPQLGTTNVVPVFRAAGRRGDFWVATLRPQTPDPVVPLDLRRVEGVAPHGPRDFFAPLAVVATDQDDVIAAVDCRSRIQPLTDGGCIACTVGDGVESFGDFSSIQEAIDALPAEGGRIVVQPGFYQERILLDSLSDVILEGCGETTVLESPAFSATPPPGAPASLIDVAASQRVTIRGFRLQPTEERGVLVRESAEVKVEGVSALAGVRGSPDFIPGADNTTIPVFDLSLSSQVELRELVAEPYSRPALIATQCDHLQAEDLTFVGSPACAEAALFPLVQIADGDIVTLRNSILSTYGQVGVSVVGMQTQDVQLSGLSIVAGSHRSTRHSRTTSSQSAVDIDGVKRVSLTESSLTMDESFTTHATVVVSGESIEIAENQLEVLSACVVSPDSPSPSPSPSPEDCDIVRVSAWGGIQLRGGCGDVVIRENRIIGGVGHGITLGSVIYKTSDGIFSRRQGVGSGQLTRRSDGFLAARGTISVSFRDEQRRVYRAEDEGSLHGITITGNRIEQMSGNGISALSVLGVPDDALIDVHDLRIEKNLISDNQRHPALNVPLNDEFLPFDASTEGAGLVIPILPFGGIVLATVTRADIRENTISDNGSSPTLPTNGIFVLNGDSIRIHGNRIFGNGGRALLDGTDALTEGPRPGVRAGIAVLLAGTGDATSVDGVRSLLQDAGAGLDDDGSSVRVTRNKVKHPEGRALQIVATGPVAIEGNFFSSEGNHGAETLAETYSVGDIIYVQNLGTPWETMATQNLNPAVFTGFTTPGNASDYLNTQTASEPWNFIGEGGRILFNNNQVTYDWEILRRPKVGFRPPLSYFPVALLTLDQLTIAGNQFAFRLRGVDNPISPLSTSPVLSGLTEPVLSQVFGVGATVEASHNRCSEAIGSTILSLFTISQLMSQAIYNQTSHELLSYNKSYSETPTRPASDFSSPHHERRGNQVLFSANFWGDVSSITPGVSDVRNFADRFLSLLWRSEN